MTIITLSALEISEFLVGQEMTLYLHSSMLLNLSCFEACKTDTQEKMVLITAVMTYSTPVFMVAAKPILGRLFLSSLGKNRQAFGMQFYIKSLQFC